MVVPRVTHLTAPGFLLPSSSLRGVSYVLLTRPWVSSRVLYGLLAKTRQDLISYSKCPQGVNVGVASS